MLKQGGLSVKEYVNKFNELARFGFDLVNTPEKKAQKFAKGLNSPLKELALSQLPFGATFEKLVEAALLNSISGPIEEAKKGVGQHQGKRKGNNHGGGHNKKQELSCRKCFKKGHFARDCKVDLSKIKCYKCGQVGHFKSNCPDLQKGEGQRARLYALETNPSNNGLPAPVVEAGRNIAMEGV